MWALANTQVFVNTAKPEVLVTRIDDELEVLESYIEEGGHALPDMLSNVAEVLGAAKRPSPVITIGLRLQD